LSSFAPPRYRFGSSGIEKNSVALVHLGKIRTDEI
jgi:hypothetical protein